MTSYVSPFTGDVVQPTDVSYAAYTLTTNIQLEWPSNVNPPEHVAARIMDITPSTGHLSMPPANQVSVGQDALIRNLGPSAFDVLDFDGNTIVSVPDGKSVYLYITDNGSTAGIWGIIDFGAGTSGGNASELAGLGLLAISTTLNQSHPSIVLDPNYTYASSDRAQTRVWDGGAGSGTLPLATDIGNNWFFLFKNNGTGTYTLNCTSSDTIDTASVKDFQPNESAFIICTGTEYISIGYGTSANFFFTSQVIPVTSGSYVITATQAQSIIQEYVGTLTGNVTVYYPPVVQLYIVSNQVVDNGFTLTVTTGIPGSIDAVVPSGNQSSLVCDGVNFLNANTVQAGGSVTSLVNGSAANPSIYFGNETNTGIYRPAGGELGVSILGVDTFNVTSTGIDVMGNVNAVNANFTGTGTFEGGISGGDFN